MQQQGLVQEQKSKQGRTMLLESCDFIDVAAVIRTQASAAISALAPALAAPEAIAIKAQEASYTSLSLATKL